MEYAADRRAAEHAELEAYRQYDFYLVWLFSNLYFRQMMEKLAEDDRIEQMNAQKRRLKQQEHKRAVEKSLEGKVILKQTTFLNRPLFIIYYKLLKSYKITLLKI